MIIQSTIPVLFPMKEPELAVQAISVNGIVNEVEVTVEGTILSFSRDGNGHFKNNSNSSVEPPYIAYIARQLSRVFN